MQAEIRMFLLVPLLLAPAPGSSVSAALPGQAPSLGAGNGGWGMPQGLGPGRSHPTAAQSPVPAGKAKNNKVPLKADGTLKGSSQGARSCPPGCRVQFAGMATCHCPPPTQ